MRRRSALALLASVLAIAPGSLVRAGDTVLVGSVGSSSAHLWPLYIGQRQGFFGEARLKLDFVFAQSNAAVIQQVAAGSTNIATNAGLVDPIRAIDKGAPLALVRIEIQAPPYALLAKPEIKRIDALKGRTVSLGGAKDITRIFVERMLTPNGVKPGEFDMIFAGATSARFAALQTGAVDAAILTAPFNFHAEALGFTNLGFTVDYLSDMPFAGMAVNRSWAAANPDLVTRFLAVFVRSIAWFEDDRNRDEAVALMVEVSKLARSDVEKAYDFLRNKKLFEPTGKVSKAKLRRVVAALQELGDLAQDFSVDRLILPGVTQVAD